MGPDTMDRFGNDLQSTPSFGYEIALTYTKQLLLLSA